MKRRTVLIASEEVEVVIVRSSRRTVALFVKPGGTLLIRAPWYVPEYSLIQFINQKSSWITRQRAKLRDVRPVSGTLMVEDGSEIPFLGRVVTVKVKQGAPGRASLRDDCLTVGVNGEASAEKISAAVEKWYLGEAKRYLTARTAELAAIHSALLPPPVNVATRKMKRRWGTCHSNGTIWLNRELIKKDPDLIDYVIIHELCHLVHHNHGRQYYTLLSSIIPGYAVIRKKLMHE